jgi:hypothetical protein
MQTMQTAPTTAAAASSNVRPRHNDELKLMKPPLMIVD